MSDKNENGHEKQENPHESSSSKSREGRRIIYFREAIEKTAEKSCSSIKRFQYWTKISRRFFLLAHSWNDR